MSHRRQQVESALKRAIATAIERDLADPRVRGMVSVTQVEATDNLQEAFVYVSVLPEQYEKRTVAGLNAATGRIIARVRQSVALRALPKLTFRLDSSVKRQAAIESAIRQGLSREGVGDEADDQEP